MPMIRISEILDVYDGYVIVNRYKDGEVTQMVDTRGTGDFPYDLMFKYVSYMDIKDNTLVLEYNDDCWRN